MFSSAIYAARFVFLFFVSALSAGCLSAELPYARRPVRPPSIDTPDTPDIRPSSAHTTRSLEEQDMLFSGQAELTLVALRQAVLQRNPSLTAMQRTWQAALERPLQVSALDDPTFSYGFAPATIGASDLVFGQRFGLSQRFPWPGTLRLRGEAARSLAQAAGEDVNTTRLQLIEATDRAFYDYYFVQRALDVNRVNQALLLEFQRTTETRYGAGLVSKQDALQAEVEHQHIVHRGIVLDHAQVVTVARLNTLLHLSPETALPPPPQTLPGVRALPPIEALQAAAIQDQPALRALALQVEARSADVHLAQLAYFPQVTVSAGYNSLWQADDLRPVVGMSLNFPLQLERRNAALREAQAQEQQAQARLEEHRAQVAFAVSQATQNVLENAHVVQLYAATLVPAAEENLAAARSDYETGITDFLTLITAEKSLTLATLNYHQALANYHKGRAELERAVGLRLEDLEVLP